ncbi:autophagy 9 [Actinidia rufa]|uniref:Autophagy-related protein 9 n=1 Tax=Actinidia rufa TaxID=165716 RepID=A0A7J0FS62_9ERIC|nr:autophagy 9 [Actinidia rufa]
MFRGAKIANGLNIFKWRRRDESSLTTGLLDDVHHEIELSDYRRAPSPGSESPSGLLNGESLNVEPIADLDLFFERLYSYYCEKGLWCIIIKWIVELLSLAFTICFSGFVLLYVDWNGLRNAKCGMDAVESGIKPCDLSKEALHQHPLVPFTLSKAIIVGYLGIFSIYWIFCFLRFFAQLKDILKIRQFYYNRNFCVRRDFISDPKTLKKRLMVVGLAMLLLSPFLVIFMLVYLFLRHAEQFYNHPSTASSRRWSNLSKWIFREFNEVDHFFKHRINSSILHASDYLKQFPSPIITIVAKFISFVSGGFAAILIIIAFLEESLLEGHIFGRNLFWYAAVFGTITAITRAAVSDELLVLDPQGAMSLVVQHTHHMPKRWRGKENTVTVRTEF